MSSPYDPIRRFVEAELAHRESDAGTRLEASDYWKDFNRIAAYVRNLNDRDLGLIRYHTFHLTGDTYLPYYFMEKRKVARLQRQYEQLMPRLDGFRPHEPVGGFGVDTPYGQINVSTVRYMAVLGDLIQSGMLNREAPTRVLELGGGYGGLAQMCLSYNPNLVWLICDLEETLFYSGAFLTLQFGADHVHPITGTAEELADLKPGHIYLLAQHRAETLLGTAFDIAVNQQSLQEMTSAQVDRYIGLIDRTAERFYSCNHNSHNQKVTSGKGIVTALHDQLAAHFQILWDSHDHEPPRVRLVRSSRIVRKLIKLTIGLDFMPKEEASMHRFVYRCRGVHGG